MLGSCVFLAQVENIPSHTTPFSELVGMEIYVSPPSSWQEGPENRDDRSIEKRKRISLSTEENQEPLQENIQLVIAMTALIIRIHLNF